MAIRFSFDDLSLPLIAAPMFLVSGPDMVVGACRAGVVGAFPALNRRTTAGYEEWLDRIEAGLDSGPTAGAERVAPHAVNLVVHRTNPRLGADLEITVRHRVPIVITSLGAARDVVSAVQEYGGIVLHDVTTPGHGERALAAGADGLIAVAGGAGGHAGTLNPFALVGELRRMTDGPIVLAGAISNGAQVAAALALGADAVSVGTRFIATRESEAAAGYKNMLLEVGAEDIVYTPKVSGINANFILRSIRDNGLDLAAMPDHDAMDVASELDHGRRAWKDIWSAGQGVGLIDDIPSVAELCARFRVEYRAAVEKLLARHPIGDDEAIATRTRPASSCRDPS